MIHVQTKHAMYVIDRDNNRWKRTSAVDPRHDDDKWVDGGFTLGPIGGGSYAHYANHPDGAFGRRTSTVISISEDPK